MPGEFTRVYSAALRGVDAAEVEPEVNETGPSSGGWERQAVTVIVGLPDTAVRENRARVRTAIAIHRLHRICGLLDAKHAVPAHRPFRAPHPTIPEAGLLGGGSNPTPGEVSIAHHGGLFLDELPEFNRATLEVMRQPLEDGKVTISRAAGSMTFPARFMLVAAMNPCPCGLQRGRHEQENARRKSLN